MRIANIILTKDFDGSIPAALSQLEYFDRLGYKQLLVYCRGGRAESLCEKFQAQHVEKYSVNKVSGISRFFNAFKLRRFLKQWSPDIVICHSYFRFVLIASKGIAPIVARLRNDNIKFLPSFDGAFSVRTDLLINLKEIYPNYKNVEYIPNMINIIPVDKRHDAFSSPPVIGAMGRFEDFKGFEDFIETCFLLKERKVAFKAIIGGDGPLKANLEALVHARELNDYITFLGWVNNRQDFFNQIDIFCLPSRQETFGRVVLEAFMYGAPIISTATSGPSDLIQSENNGILVTTDNPEAMANAIENWMQYPEIALECGQKGQKSAQKYSYEVLGKKLDAFLKKTLSKEHS